MDDEVFKDRGRLTISFYEEDHDDANTLTLGHYGRNKIRHMKTAKVDGRTRIVLDYVTDHGGYKAYLATSIRGREIEMVCQTREEAQEWIHGEAVNWLLGLIKLKD